MILKDTNLAEILIKAINSKNIIISETINKLTIKQGSKIYSISKNLNRTDGVAP
jgi:hypothetical protein